MNGDKPVTATFPYAFMARVNSSQVRYDSLAQAYAGAAASDKILARDVTFIENLILGGGKTITLSRGDEHRLSAAERLDDPAGDTDGEERGAGRRPAGDQVTRNRPLRRPG